MFKSLAEMFGGNKREQVPDYDDAVLGKMRFTEGGIWRAHVTVAGRHLGFAIGGHTEPSSALLAHARDIVRNFADFESMISAFLADERCKIKMTPDEISQLQLDEVILCWPERPNDGLIYFRGPDDNRVWRCDYVDRKPKRLGFDD